MLAPKPRNVSFVAHPFFCFLFLLEVKYRVVQPAPSLLHHMFAVGCFFLWFPFRGGPMPAKRLAASSLTPRASSQTRPNLGGVNDLSVSKQIGGYHGSTGQSPAAIFPSPGPPWQKHQAARVRGRAWQVDSTASSQGRTLAGPGNWPHCPSNAPGRLQSKANLTTCQHTQPTQHTQHSTHNTAW